jgi:hypothetical protein
MNPLWKRTSFEAGHGRVGVVTSMKTIAKSDHLTLGMWQKDREKRLERRLGASQRAAA